MFGRVIGSVSKACLLHARRVELPLANEINEALARDLLDDLAHQGIAGLVVGILGPGRLSQGKLCLLYTSRCV